MDIQVVDISAVLGLFAMATLTINVLLGMLLSTAYKINPVWKRLPAALKVINVNRLHNLTAYIALGLVLLHPLLLTFDSRTKFTVADIFYPVHAPHQKLIVSLGTISLFAIITVIITTQKKIKKKIKFRLWKNIHFISYGTAMLFIVHGLKMDPELKDRPTDWLDGEKLLCWACLLILMAATFLRIQYHNRTIRNRS
jgi:methionine sulfoxide reductase heme-binding subunit